MLENSEYMEAAQERTVEIVTMEILALDRQVGQMLLGYAIEIGRRLIEAKSMLPHGSWGTYIRDRLGYSQSTANNLMRVFEAYGKPQQSLFGAEANSQALANLSYTKALRLLSLPDDERETFVKENHVEDMSTRELEAALRERDEAVAERKAAEEARAQMAADMKMANDRLSAAREESDAAAAREAALRAELEELRARPIEVVGAQVPDQDALDAARKEGADEGRKTAEEKMRAKLEKAKEDARKAEERRKAAEDALEAARKRLEEQAMEEKKSRLSTDKDVAQFEVFFNQGQELANKMRGLLLKVRGREDSSAAQGMVNGILAMAEAIRRCAE